MAPDENCLQRTWERADRECGEYHIVKAVGSSPIPSRAAACLTPTVQAIRASLTGRAANGPASRERRQLSSARTSEYQRRSANPLGDISARITEIHRTSPNSEHRLQAYLEMITWEVPGSSVLLVNRDEIWGVVIPTRLAGPLGTVVYEAMIGPPPLAWSSVSGLASGRTTIGRPSVLFGDSPLEAFDDEYVVAISPLNSTETGHAALIVLVPDLDLKLSSAAMLLLNLVGTAVSSTIKQSESDRLKTSVANQTELTRRLVSCLTDPSVDEEIWLMLVGTSARDVFPGSSARVVVRGSDSLVTHIYSAQGHSVQTRPNESDPSLGSYSMRTGRTFSAGCLSFGLFEPKDAAASIPAKHGLESVFAVPIKGLLNEPVGVLALTHVEPFVFTKEVIELVKNLGELATAGIIFRQNRALAQLELKRHEQLAKALEKAPDGIVIFEVDGSIVYANERCALLFGYHGGQLRTKSVSSLLSDTQRAKLAQEDPLAVLDATGSFEADFVCVRRDGSEFIAGVSISKLDEAAGSSAGYVANIRDATARAANGQGTWTGDSYDALTSVLTRPAFARRLQEALNDLPKDRQLAVVLTDLDGFRIINATYGHAVGDEMLVAAGRALADGIRVGDFIGRLGGDIFAVCVNGIYRQSQGRAVVDRIATRVAKASIDVDGHAIAIEASFGVAFANGRDPDPEHLLEEAARSLTSTKRPSSALAQPTELLSTVAPFSIVEEIEEY